MQSRTQLAAGRGHHKTLLYSISGAYHTGNLEENQFLEPLLPLVYSLYIYDRYEIYI